MVYNPENLLFICPTILPSDHFSKTALDFLPVDTGIEIECNVPKDWDKSWLDDIPGIVNNFSTRQELRIRVRPGLEGFNTIYNLCNHLNSKNYILTESAIHFHVDITGFEDNIRKIHKDTELNKWIKEQILAWDHIQKITGSGYIFFKKHNTIEIRCGKMTFNYQEMIKDIVLSHYIVKYIKLKSEFSDFQIFKKRLDFENLMFIKSTELIGQRFIPFNFK